MTRFVQRTLLPAPASLAFEWHTRKGALQRLTPPWERVELIRSDHSLNPGSQVEMRIKIGPFRKTWIAEHRRLVPGVEFQDVQVSGPFARFEHTHKIIPQDADTCWLEDDIDYALPLGTLGQWVAGGFIRRQLGRMFRYRHAVTEADLLALHPTHKKSTTMKIAVTGATGLVGSALCSLLTTAGHDVLRLVRGKTQDANDIPWDPARGELSTARLEGVDAVVHLAGENIAGARWTTAFKERIRTSRVEGTRLLCETLARLKQPPKVLVCASATGFYGDRGNEELTENSSAGSGYLPEVCQAWEAACQPARQAVIRVVNLRIGVILAAQGGALQKMLLPFKLGGGGIVGSGQQYWSWIALDDVIGAIQHAIITETISGPVNAVAPHTATNYEFTKTLGRVLRRPTVLPMPGFAARLLLGGMAQDLLLASARVVPEKLETHGYRFRFPELEGALRHVLGQ